MRTNLVFLICIGLALGKKVPKRSADEPFTLTFGNGGSGSGSSGTGSGSPSGGSTGGGGCSYKGQTYSQGQTWKDGCDYNCQCTDGSVGRYQCRSVCPQYTNLPAQCTLVKDANGCCSTPQCNFQSSGGAGSGSGTSGSGSSGTGTFTLTQTGSGSCSDKLTNCAEYGQSVCTNSNYATWVNDNCCAYCGGSSSSGSSSGTGSQTGGMTGTGTSGSGSSGSGGDPFQLVFNTQAPGTISGSGSGTGTGSCSDRLSNCPQYGRDVCTNSNYATWVHDNCCAYCAGGSGSGTSGSGTSGSGTSGTGSSGSGSSGSGGDPFQLVFQTQAPGTISGSGSGSSSCADSLPNCAAYTKATCTDPNYDRWVRDHCAKYCNKCGSLTGTGSGSATGTGSGGTSGTGGLPVAQPGRVITGFGPVSGGGSGTGTMTGGTGTGTGGTGTGTSGGTGGSFTFTNCMDKSTSCSLMESQQHICSTASARVYAQQNCAKTCNMCSGSSSGTGGTMTGTGTGGTMTGTGSGGTMTGTGTGTCRDSIPNCKDYTQATCTNSNYATWVSKNCPAYCNKCSSMSGGGTMTGTGTGSGTMTGTGSGTVTGTGTGGTITGTGTGTGGGISGQSTGCVYKSKIYQQGQTWKDACQYSCSCTNASTGQYQCSSLCVTWNLPSACHMSPPGPGKCCPTPSCPPGYNIQYPAGYVAN